MMTLDKPIGDPAFGPLFLRLALGAFFIFSGLAKIDEPSVLIEQVKATEVLAPKWATVYAILLPYLEIVGGGLLVAGFWTTLGALITTLCVGSVMYLFGPSLGTTVAASGVFKGSQYANKEIILLAASIAILYTGPGAIAMDKLKRTHP
jgi:uncharacterized membrane protein YphA (DoxX/SURF4 family)